LEKLESLLQSHPEQCAMFVAPVQQAFLDTKQFLAEKLQTNDSSSAHTNENIEELSLVLHKLKADALVNEASETQLDELQGFEQGQFGTQVRSIYQAINDFEFELAVEQIDVLLETLNQQEGAAQ
jgi:hypothetical protein